MANESKLHLFRYSKNTLTISNYLTQINDRKIRSAICKLRLGTTPLQIEIGRKMGLPREERLCKICVSNEVEDEQHFLFECQALSRNRVPYLELLTRLHPGFCNFSNTQRLNYLFFNEMTPKNILEIAGNMLVALQGTRESLLLLKTQ